MKLQKNVAGSPVETLIIKGSHGFYFPICYQILISIIDF